MTNWFSKEAVWVWGSKHYKFKEFAQLTFEREVTEREIDAETNVWSNILLKLKLQKLDLCPQRLCCINVYASDCHILKDFKQCFFENKWDVFALGIFGETYLFQIELLIVSLGNKHLINIFQFHLSNQKRLNSRNPKLVTSLQN